MKFKTIKLYLLESICILVFLYINIENYNSINSEDCSFRNRGVGLVLIDIVRDILPPRFSCT